MKRLNNGQVSEGAARLYKVINLFSFLKNAHMTEIEMAPSLELGVIPRNTLEGCVTPLKTKKMILKNMDRIPDP